MTNEEFIERIRLEGEEWKPVVGYEDRYMVSSFGRVARKMIVYNQCNRYHAVVLNQKILKSYIKKIRNNQYEEISLSTSGKKNKP